MSRVAVLGVGVDPIPFEAVLARVERAVVARERITVAYANVHVCNAAAEDEALRAWLNAADVCFCDGNGVRLGARLLGQRLPYRMTGADWIWTLAAHAEEAGWRIFWIGGAPGVSARAAEALQARHPALRLATEHGFLAREGEEDQACLARINAFQPDVLLVGMGTPEQERWVAARRDRLDAPVVWCLGATADFVTGKVSRGPQWMLDNHLEWLARLIVEPGRLWRRYLVGNPLFLARVLRERLGQRNAK